MDNLIELVDWSRAQFALTAIYHWLFVPLTLGLGIIIAVMETIYFRTKSEKWLATTKFWMTSFLHHSTSSTKSHRSWID